MANLEIVLFPHDILKKPSRELTLEEIASDKFKMLVSEMYAAMYRMGGIGLAAPQVGANIRVIVLNPTGKRDFHSYAMCLINPSFIPLDGSETAQEGCLSIPEIYAPVTRTDRIHVKATSINGVQTTFECNGILSRIIQHEIDHLDGITFLDRLDEMSRNTVEPHLIEHLRRVERIREKQEKARKKQEAKEKKRKKDKERLKKQRRGNYGDWQNIFD